MRLIVIRHGRPEWRLPRLISLFQFERALIDYDHAHLSREGINATAALITRLPKALILSSDLPRAQETAEIIARESKATIKCDSLFRELLAPSIGKEVVGRLCAPPVIWSLVHWCCWVAGIGECLEGPRAAWSRAAKAANTILTCFDAEEDVILVSHGWFIILLTQYLRWHKLIERGPFLPRASYGAMTEYLLRRRDSYVEIG